MKMYQKVVLYTFLETEGTSGDENFYQSPLEYILAELEDSQVQILEFHGEELELARSFLPHKPRS